jgi:hypothetical protein
MEDSYMNSVQERFEALEKLCMELRAVVELMEPHMGKQNVTVLISGIQDRLEENLWELQGQMVEMKDALEKRPPRRKTRPAFEYRYGDYVLLNEEATLEQEQQRTDDDIGEPWSVHPLRPKNTG